MLKVLIVDDENKSPQSLKILLEIYFNKIEELTIAPSIDEALLLLENCKPDVVILDVKLREYAIDILIKSKINSFEVVFMSGFQGTGKVDLQFFTLDYLLKPINLVDLRETILTDKKEEGVSKNKVDFFSQNQPVDASKTLKMVLRTSSGLKFISIKDIIYCEASSNYTIFHIRNRKTYVVSKTLKEYEDLLSDHNFSRIHHSFLINLGELKKYIKGEGGSVVMSNGNSLFVSKRKREAFLNKLSELTINWE